MSVAAAPHCPTGVAACCCCVDGDDAQTSVPGKQPDKQPVVRNHPPRGRFTDRVVDQGRRKGGVGGSDDPPFLGVNLIHFLYKVLGQRSVQKKNFLKLTFKTTPPWKVPSYAPVDEGWGGGGDGSHGNFLFGI